MPASEWAPSCIAKVNGVAVSCKAEVLAQIKAAGACAPCCEGGGADGA
eukprot:SAG11_NODE_21538_length_423_cov_0.950617_1_plen_47_part_10